MNINKIIYRCSRVGGISQHYIKDKKNKDNLFRKIAISMVMIYHPSTSNNELKELFGIGKGACYTQSLKLGQDKIKDQYIKEMYLKCCEE